MKINKVALKKVLQHDKSLIAVMVIGLVLIALLSFTMPSPKETVKVVSTTTSQKGLVARTSTTSTGTSDATSSVQVTQQTTPAKSSVSNGQILTAASTTAPSAGGSSTLTTPQPSYHIALRPDEAYTQQVVPGVMQYVVPFDIVFDAGFVPTFTSADAPGCQFLTTPAANYGVLCNVSQKESDTGLLVMQHGNGSVAGHYAVQVSYSISGVVKTDSVAFDLN